MRLKSLPLFLLLALFFVACSTPKDVTYFQGIEKLTPQQIEQMNQTYSSRIYEDDLLTITVTGWDPTVMTPFNPPVYAYATQGETGANSSQQLHTYLVGQDGTINFPILGQVKASGLSKSDLAENIRQEIAKYVKDPIVNVQIVNYKVTLLGEVSRPGAVTVKNDRLSILDALGQVGDLTINAERTNILVIRDNNGQKEMGRLDITQPEIFASPYYYLRQNDVVYVEPNKAKKKNARYSQAQQYNITVISSILSAISVVTSVIVAIAK